MRFEFKLTGKTAMLMHADNVEWADTVGAWRLDTANKKKKGEGSGDDRRPAWVWAGYCYRNEAGEIAIPSANLTGCLKRAGQRVPRGRNSNFKELAVSGLFLETEYLAFTNGGRPVPLPPLEKLISLGEFPKHVEVAKKAGFLLDVRRVPIGMSKHIRVRPRFNEWAVSGVVEITDDQITEDDIRSIFDQAGRVGLGDFRPGSKSPGTFGMFDSELKKLK